MREGKLKCMGGNSVLSRKHYNVYSSLSSFFWAHFVCHLSNLICRFDDGVQNCIEGGKCFLLYLSYLSGFLFWRSKHVPET